MKMQENFVAKLEEVAEEAIRARTDIVVVRLDIEIFSYNFQIY